MATLTSIQFASLQELAARLLETRAADGGHELLARELLVGFCDVCLRCGLDGVLNEVALTDDIVEHPELVAALAAKLGNKADYDARGPRNAKPKQLADAVLAVLGVTVVDVADRAITMSANVRADVAAALAAVIDIELAAPKLRADVIDTARAKCEERHLVAFDKIAAQLDERGMRMLRQPKLSLDAVHAIQQLLIDARFAVIARAANAAIDRAKQALGPEAAKRIEQPITLRLTPRDVAIRNVADARVSKLPAAVVAALLDNLTMLVPITWLSQERAARAYSVRETFAVGDEIEHPKFGRGTVLSVATQNVEVEFSDGKLTLVHARK